MLHRKEFLSIFIILIGCASQKIQNENIVSDYIYNDEQVSYPSYEGFVCSEETLVELNPCPSDMVHIVGEFCPGLVETCLKWSDPPLCVKRAPKTKACIKYNAPMRCAEFQYPSKCISKTIHMDFCIDKYEFPNQEGVKPKLQNTWFEASQQCNDLGKRLCSENEWTQSCRGPDNLPYPYGYKRDSNACRIDLKWIDPWKHTFEEVDQTAPAGSYPKCVSAYGVYDLTGNGDEWTRSNSSKGNISVLKGGHPCGVRNRCTTSTISHGPEFTFYDTGFRCCKDAQ